MNTMPLDHKLRVNGRPQMFDRRGRSITTLKFARYCEDMKYRIIRQEHVKGHLVSTVWLGIDHNFGYRGKPIVFETMIFAGPGGTAGEQWRWSTEADALEGHRQVVCAIHLGAELERFSPRPSLRLLRKKRFRLSVADCIRKRLLRALP